jgi:DNA-binding ferritin-like protein
MTKFIEESIEFTIDKFSQILQNEGVKANSFHIRKVLRTLQDRARHLKIVSESFASQGNALFSRLDFYDSELAHEISQRLQKIAWFFSIAALLYTMVAFIQRTF